MNTSTSTPRIRQTQGLYALLLLAVALTGGRTFAGIAGLAAQAGGFVLVGAGTLFRLWTSAYIAGRKDLELVQDGPYARCRHPLYLGSLVAGLGLALSTRSVVLTLGVPALLAVLHTGAIRSEERSLQRAFGDEWSRYAARVGLLWPRLGVPGPMGRREVDLAVYRKAFLDAASMLGLWLLLVTADVLRQSGPWDGLFALP